MAQNQGDDTFLLRDAVRDAMDREVKSRYETLKNEFIEQLDRDKDQICAGILLTLEKHVTFKTMGQELVITIRKIEK